MCHVELCGSHFLERGERQLHVTVLQNIKLLLHISMHLNNNKKLTVSGMESICENIIFTYC